MNDYQYSLPGFNGTPLVYTFRWRHLIDPQTNASILTSPYTQLYYPGDYHCGPFNYETASFNSLSPSLFQSTNPHNPICASALYNPIVLSEIVLPNGSSYRFTYNPWGEIAKMYFPTGGYERYQYDEILPMSFMKQPFRETNRGVTHRWISSDGVNEIPSPWQYGVEFTPGTGSLYATTMTAPDGTFTRTFLHAQPDPYNGNWHHSFPYSFDNPNSGKAYDERVYTCSTGPMLSRVLTQWTTSGPTSGGFYLAARSPRVAKQIEIVMNPDGSNALAKTTAYEYDQDLNRTLISEYGYVVLDSTTAENAVIGSIAQGPLLRTTEATFLVNDPAIDSSVRANYRARNLLGLQTSTRVKDAPGNIVAQTSVKYDESAFPLLTGGSPTGWTDPGTLIRGNPTTTGRWLNTSNTYLESHAQYDQYGNLRKSWDARDTSLSNPSQVEYSSSYQFAYATTMTSSVPDSTGQYGSNQAFVSTVTYDANTGFITSTTDANNKTTSFGYIDPQTSVVEYLNRVRTVSKPDGGLTTFYYDDTVGSLSVKTLTKQDATRSIENTQYFDGLGRPSRSFLKVSGNSFNTSDTQYDAMNRVWRVSNPYVSSGPDSQINPSGNWTTNAYDKLGRVISVTASDGAMATNAYGLSTSNVFGLTAVVTGQVTRTRRSITDAFDRLVRVDEPDNYGNLGDVTSPNQSTAYVYDVMGNLRSVTQGSQQRFFSYDSLSRLLRVRIPEQLPNISLPALTDAVTGNAQWTFSYAYDNNDNLTTRVDARNISTSYVYDGMNRNTSVTYANDPTNTPSITRKYDGAASGKGTIWITETSGNSRSRTTMGAFDASGRATNQSQQFYSEGGWSLPFDVTRTYDLVGHVLSQNYPSGHTVNYSYDEAGRTSNFVGTLGDNTSRVYANEFQYAESGGLQQEKFGTDIPVYHKQRFNQRGQLWDVRVSTKSFVEDASDGDRGAIVNYYHNNFVAGGSGVNNNGNVLRQEIYVPGNGFFQQNFGYDSLNRLTSVSEKLNGAGSEQFRQAYNYDRWGNRTIDQSNTFGTGINNRQFTVSALNQLGVPSGQSGEMIFDAAGNLTKDTYSATATARVYDAENRMTSETQTGAILAGTYTYNGDGQRVRRKSGNVETWQVYGFDGELLAEYAQNGSYSSPQKEYGYRNGQLLITADASSAPPVPIFSDNYNDNLLDNAKWTVFDPNSPAVVTEQAQRLQISLPPSMAAYNGVYSNSTYDFRGKTVQVEVPQTASEAGWCETYLQVVLDSQNYS